MVVLMHDGGDNGVIVDVVDGVVVDGIVVVVDGVVVVVDSGGGGGGGSGADGGSGGDGIFLPNS